LQDKIDEITNPKANGQSLKTDKTGNDKESQEILQVYQAQIKSMAAEINELNIANKQKTLEVEAWKIRSGGENGKDDVNLDVDKKYLKQISDLEIKVVETERRMMVTYNENERLNKLLNETLKELKLLKEGNPNN